MGLCTGIGLFLIAGCDQTFDPNGPFEQKLVVYAILSTHSDTQYVRVYRTAPPGNRLPSTPLNLQVTDARVSVSYGTKIFPFRDTTLNRMDQSGNRVDVHAYVAYSFLPEQAVPYTLSINSPSSGQVMSTATSLYYGTLFVVTQLTTRAPAEDIAVHVAPAINARAYFVRMFLEYETLSDTVWQRRRVEIPQNLRLNEGTGGVEFIYPTPVPRGSRTLGASGLEEVLFRVGAYREIIARLNAEFPTGTLRYAKALFVLTQMDDALYAYYSITHGFPNSVTIRLDEPDYSNVQGGLGIFGMSTEHTTSITFLPGN